MSKSTIFLLPFIMLSLFICSTTAQAAIPPWNDSDLYGYTADNQIPFTWENMSNASSLSLSDNQTRQINLGFSFVFYGSYFSSVFVSSNGFLSFTANTAAPTNASIPDTSLPNAMIAAFWDDLDPSAGGTVRYKTAGTIFQHRCVVEFNKVPFAGADENVSFQIVMFEGSNEIHFYYQNVSASVRCSGEEATIGIEDPLGNLGIQYSYNNGGAIENQYGLQFISPDINLITPTPTPTFTFTETPTPTETNTPTVTPTPTLGNVNIRNIGLETRPFPELWVSVDVADRNDDFISNLDISDFSIRERIPGVSNWTPQPFAADLDGSCDEPISIALCFDKSGSMWYANRIFNARSGTIDFINTFGPWDQMALITFNAGVDIELDFTRDKDALRNTVNNITPLGGTALYDGMYVSTQLTKHHYGLKAVVVLSDGEDTSSNRPLSDALTIAKAHRMKIYTIGMSIRSGSQIEQQLIDIADQTSGVYYPVRNRSTLLQAYQDIRTDIQTHSSGHYQFNYLSTNSSYVGVQHELEICAQSACRTLLFDADLNCLFDINRENFVGNHLLSSTQMVAQYLTNNSAHYYKMYQADFYFEATSPGSVNCYLYSDLNGTPGQKVGEAINNPVEITCNGWWYFEFAQSGPYVFTIDANTDYWLVLEHDSGADVLARHGNPGTARGGLSLGTVSGSTVSWSPLENNDDLYCRVFACQLPPPTPTPTPPFPQTATPTPSPSPTLAPVNFTDVVLHKDDFPIVDVSFGLVDGQGQFISGLSASDFVLSETIGINPPQDQNIIILNPQDFGSTSIVMCVDASGSMDGQNIDLARDGASYYFNNYMCRDEMAIMTFAYQISTIQGFTRDIASLEQAMSSINPDGATSLFDAIYEAANLLSLRQPNRAIYVLSDGEDTFSSHSIDEAIFAAQSSNCPVHTIGLNVQSGTQADTDLKRISNQTGGLNYVVSDVTEIQQAFDTFANAVSTNVNQNVYRLSYVAINQTEFSSRRNVSISYDVGTTMTRYIPIYTCLSDWNRENFVGNYPVDAANRVAQSYVNATSEDQELIHVSVFFDFISPTIVNLDLRQDGGGVPGPVYASPNTQDVHITCAGWYDFDFIRGQPILLNQTETYWFVITHGGGDEAYVRHGTPGTAVGGIITGAGADGNVTWGAFETSDDMYIKIKACAQGSAPTPTSTPTMRPPTSTPTITPTGTRTNPETPSATPTPTITPTPDRRPSTIPLGGYWDTDIDQLHGGLLHIVVLATDPNIETVELWYSGQPTGLHLLDDGTNGDFSANDDIYGFLAPIDPTGTQMEVLIDIMTNMQDGSFVQAWPFLIVK